MGTQTTLSLKPETLKRLRVYELHKNESYNDILERMLNLLDKIIDNTMHPDFLNPATYEASKALEDHSDDDDDSDDADEEEDESEEI